MRPQVSICNISLYFHAKLEPWNRIKGKAHINISGVQGTSPSYVPPTSWILRDISVTSHQAIISRHLVELTACWDKLQGQIDGKQAWLEQTLYFQQLYQEALLNISGWLDDIEQCLLRSKTPEQDIEKHCQENEVGVPVTLWLISFKKEVEGGGWGC